MATRTNTKLLSHIKQKPYFATNDFVLYNDEINF